MIYGEVLATLIGPKQNILYFHDISFECFTGL